MRPQHHLIVGLGIAGCLVACLAVLLLMGGDSMHPEREDSGAADVQLAPSDPGFHQPESGPPPGPDTGSDGAASPERTDLPADVAPQLVVRFSQERAPVPDVRVEVWRVAHWSERPEAPELVALSDAQGRVAVLQPLQGRFRLEFSGPTVPVAMVGKVVQLEPETPTDLGEIALPQVGTVTGRVMGAMGQPLAGAWVLLSQGDTWGPTYDTETTDPAQLDPGAGVRTDDQGRFELRKVPPGDVRIRVEAPGHEPGRLRAKMPAGGSVEAGAVQLNHAPGVRGRVVLADGSPLAGVQVVPCTLSSATLPSFATRHMRFAARTDGEGVFQLDSAGRWTDALEVVHQDYVMDAFHKLDWQQGHVALPLQLVQARPAVTLVGYVRGLQGPDTQGLATIQLEESFDDRAMDLVPHGHELTYRRYPVDADGRFEVPRCHGGSWEATVRIGDAVVLDEEPFRWHHGDGPVELVVPQQDVRSLVVEVRDDLGEPVVGAQCIVTELGPDRGYTWGPDAQWERNLFRLTSRAMAKDLATDREGRLELPVRVSNPLSEEIGVGVFSPHHLRSARRVQLAELGEPMRLTLQRAGALAGVMLQPELTRHCTVAAHASRVDGEGGGWSRVDAQGRFAIQGLAPGRYRVSISLVDASEIKQAAARPPEVIPVLEVPWRQRQARRGSGARDPFAAGIEVEVQAGETTQVELGAPPMSQVRGRVTFAGQPMAGVRVFAVHARTLGGSLREWLQAPEGRAGIRSGRPVGMGEAGFFDTERAGDFSPRMVTSPDGEFSFFGVAEGTSWIFARAPGAAATPAPVQVTVRGPGEEHQLEIQIPSAEVGGSVDPAQLPRHPQKDGLARVFARLIRPEGAALYPFTRYQGMGDPIWGHHMDVDHQRLDELGRFRFTHVPDGDWILRLHTIGQRERTLWQQLVQVRGGASVELGVIPLQGARDITLRLRVPNVPPEPEPQQPRYFRGPGWQVFAVQLRLQLPGIPQGAFAAEVRFRSPEGGEGGGESELVVPSLVPGRYLVELQHPLLQPDRVAAGARTLGITVAPDGAVDPAVLDWSQLELRELTPDEQR